MRLRLCLFDSDGKFRRAWDIGFAADSIRVLPQGLVLVRDARTGQFHAFDKEGAPRQNDAAAPPDTFQTRVLDARSGVITPGSGGQIQVRLDKPGEILLSLQPLDADQNGNAYVAVESTPGESAGEGLAVEKTVRKYAADGKLVCETSAMPLDYYVIPVDELRAHDGVIYQLMTTDTEVEINVWNTR